MLLKGLITNRKLNCITSSLKKIYGLSFSIHMFNSLKEIEGNVVVVKGGVPKTFNYLGNSLPRRIK